MIARFHFNITYTMFFFEFVVQPERPVVVRVRTGIEEMTLTLDRFDGVAETFKDPSFHFTSIPRAAPVASSRRAAGHLRR